MTGKPRHSPSQPRQVLQASQKARPPDPAPTAKGTQVQQPMIALSLGAGVQSSTLLLMADAGEFDVRPDFAVFADTGWEPRAVYDWLEKLEGFVSIPIHRVSARNIREDLIAIATVPRRRFASVPFFLDDGTGKAGMGRRQCTEEYKLRPIREHYRRLLGKSSRARIAPGTVEAWIGISLDEAHRMKPSREQWITTRWPLIEKRMTRHDCLRWLEARGYPAPPKSSCIGCPMHGNATWRKMRDEDPEAWADAVAVDKIIRSGGTAKEVGMRGKQFMHRSLIPLEAVDLSTAADHGQLDIFGNECEGICGV